MENQVSQEYVIPSHVDAVVIEDNQRYNKDHFVINENFRVTLLTF